MATTDHFNALALYPGGQGGCGVRFADPYPDALPSDLWRINLPKATVLNLLYNIKAWNVLLSAGLKYDGTLPSRLVSSVEIGGQFTACSALADMVTLYESGSYYLRSTTLAPKEKVCGACRVHDESHDDADLNEPYLTPALDFTLTGLMSDASHAVVMPELTVRNGDGSLAGNMTCTALVCGNGAGDESQQPRLYCSLAVQNIFWKPDNDTCDLFIRIDYRMELVWEYSGRMDLVSIGSDPDGAIKTFEMVLFGVTVPAYVYGSGSVVGAPTFNYDVAVSEGWTY